MKRQDRKTPSAKPADANGHTKNRRAPSSDKARAVDQGDISPDLSAAGVENFEVAGAVHAAQTAEVEAVQDVIANHLREDKEALKTALQAIMAGASPDDAAMLREAVTSADMASRDHRQAERDSELAEGWREGGYPYRNLLSRRSY